MLPSGCLPNLAQLGKDLINDFDPFIQGSFLYWGADHALQHPVPYRWTSPRRLVGPHTERIRICPTTARSPFAGTPMALGRCRRAWRGAPVPAAWCRWRSWPARIPGPQHVGCGCKRGRQHSCGASADASTAAAKHGRQHAVRIAGRPRRTAGRPQLGSCPTSAPTSRRCWAQPRHRSRVDVPPAHSGPQFLVPRPGSGADPLGAEPHSAITA